MLVRVGSNQFALKFTLHRFLRLKVISLLTPFKRAGFKSDEQMGAETYLTQKNTDYLSNIYSYVRVLAKPSRTKRDRSHRGQVFRKSTEVNAIPESASRGGTVVVQHPGATS